MFDLRSVFHILLRSGLNLATVYGFCLRFSIATAAEIAMPESFPAIEANPTKNRETSIRVLAREGRLMAVQELLAERVDPNAQGSFGETALQYASRMGHLKVVRALMRAGADPWLENTIGENAVSKSIRNCQPAILREILLPQPAHKLTWKDTNDRTLLHYAVESECLLAVDMLLSKRSWDLEARDAANHTVLELAEQFRATELDTPGVFIYYRLKALKPNAATTIDAVVKRAP